MKSSRKYSYLMLLLLIIVLIICSRNKRLSSDVPITESSVTVMDEDRSYSPESNSLAEKEVFTSLETEAQTEIERPHVIEGIPGYEDADRFPGDMVFASQESITLLADIYREIGFEGEFQSGDRTVYNYYKQKFALLLEGRVKMYDLEGNESILYDRYVPMRGYEEKGCDFYFFDMDGDGIPELCVQGTAGTYVCKYDADSNQYMEWWGTTNSGCFIVGTRRIAEDHTGDTERLFLLDKNGRTEDIITFNISYRPEKKYLVSVPDFEERVSDGQIPDSMKQQILYDEFWHTYYLRVTKVQYKELLKGLHEVEKIAEKERVPISYFIDSGN